MTADTWDSRPSKKQFQINYDGLSLDEKTLKKIDDATLRDARNENATNAIKQGEASKISVVAAFIFAAWGLAGPVHAAFTEEQDNGLRFGQGIIFGLAAVATVLGYGFRGVAKDSKKNAELLDMALLMKNDVTTLDEAGRIVGHERAQNALDVLTRDGYITPQTTYKKLTV